MSRLVTVVESVGEKSIETARSNRRSVSYHVFKQCEAEIYSGNS